MDRITRLIIKNVRAIEAIELELSHPITVLIGENGSAKSTILECLELLRKASDPSFMQQLYTVHRGLPGLLRKGATELSLGVRVEDDEKKLPYIEYEFVLGRQGAGAVVLREDLRLELTDEIRAAWSAYLDVESVQAEINELTRQRRNLTAPTSQNKSADTPNVPTSGAYRTSTNRRRDPLATKIAILRDRLTILQNESQSWSQGKTRPVLKRTLSGGGFSFKANPSETPTPFPTVPDRLIISAYGPTAPHSSLDRLLTALRGIEVHLDFDLRASWAMRTAARPESVRGATTHFPADRLGLLGVNLANAWSELRGRSARDWEETLDLVRLGLGDRLDSVVITPDHGGGNIYLALRFVDLPEPVPAADLSDGQLTWLAFVAMVRLNPSRSLLAVDEPELHLHPALLGRVMSLLCNLEGAAPVLVSTHSDRVLELLEDPASALRVCSLDGGKAIVSRLDETELPRWLEQFGDLGQLRASGYLPRVLRSEASTTEGPVE